MNKIYKIVKRSNGQQTVASELAKGARKGTKVLALAVAVMATMSAQAKQVAIEGVAVGTEAVAIGEDSWATSTSGQALGHEAVATGTDIDRARFTELKNQYEDALNKYKNAQDAVTFAGNNITANNNAIDDLRRQIDDLARQQKAVESKIRDKEALEARKNPLSESLVNKQSALDQAKGTLDGIVDSKGKNLYLNFTDLLNTLNWKRLNQGGDSSANRDALATELKGKVEGNFADFADRYTQKDYRNIVDGFINRQASYQGSLEGIKQAAPSAANYAYSYVNRDWGGSNDKLFNNIFYNLEKETADVASYNESLELKDKAVSTRDTNISYSYINSDGLSISLGTTDTTLERQGKPVLNGVPDRQKYLNRIIVASTLSKNQNKYVIGAATRLIQAPRDKTKVMHTDTIDLGSAYKKWALARALPVSSSYFGIKKTNGSLMSPTFTDEGLGIITKLHDYSINNNNLITAEDIRRYNLFHSKLKALETEIDWQDAEAPIDLNDYRTKLSKVIAYNDKIKAALDTYQAILTEAAKPDADRSRIDSLTEQLINAKKEIIEGARDRGNFAAGIEVVETAKAEEYVNAVMPEAKAIINRINTELKLYNDKDELIVAATTRAKEAQKAYDTAKAEVDKLKGNIADIDKQIAGLGLTADEEAVSDLKAQKERELAEAEAKKEELARELAEKQDALNQAQGELNNSNLANQGLRNIAHGHQAFASGNDSIAIGTNATATRQEAIVIGANSSVAGVKSIAVGSGNTVTGGDSFVAGNNNTVGSNQVVAIGNNINVDAGLNGSVVLGHESAAAAANPTEKIQIRNVEHTFAGTNPTSTVSVGSAGKERQIVNVAAGRVTESSTDAINGSQLYAVVDAVNKLKADQAAPAVPATNTELEEGHGISITTAPLTAGNGNKYTVALSEATKAQLAKEETVVGTGNISVTKPRTNSTGGQEFEVALNSDLTGMTSIGKDAGKKISFTDNGISANGSKLTDIAAPTAGTDAANKQYVDDNRVDVNGGRGITVNSTAKEGGGKSYTIELADDVKAQIAKEESVAGSDNISVSQDKANGTGGKEYTVKLNKDLTGINSISHDGTRVSLEGGNLNVNGATITNVAAPKAANDATNKTYVDKGRTTVTEEDGISVTATPKADGNGFDYAVGLSEDTKAQLAKEESVSAGRNIVVTEGETNATGGKDYVVGLSRNLTAIDSLGNGKTNIKLGDKQINVGGATISNLATPAKAGDAANKKYVDDTRTTVGSSNGSIGVTKTGYHYDLVSNHNLIVGDGNNSLNLGHNSRLDLVGSDNINTKLEGGRLSIDLSDSAKAQIAKQSSVTGQGNIKVTANQLNSTGGQEYSVSLSDNLDGISSIGKGNQKLSFTDNGISANGNKITNLAKPTDSTDAANKQYVDDTNTKVTSEDATVTIKKTTDDKGATVYDLSVGDSIARTTHIHTLNNHLEATVQDLSHLENRLDGLDTRVTNLDNIAKSGIAGANAAASLPHITHMGKSMVSVATGGYHNKVALAVGYSRMSDNGRVVFKSHINANNDKKIGYGVGLGLSW